MSPNIMKFSFFSLAYCIQQILAYPNGYSGGQPQQQVIVGQQTGFYSSDSNSNSIVGNFLPLRRTQNIKLGSIESRTPSPLCSVPNLHFGEPIQPLKLNPNVPQLAYKESAYFPVYKTANLPRCFARYTETAVRNLCWFQKRRVESLEVCLTLCLGAGMAFGTDCASATFHPASYTCRLYDKSLRAIEADAHMQYGIDYYEATRCQGCFVEDIQKLLAYLAKKQDKMTAGPAAADTVKASTAIDPFDCGVATTTSPDINTEATEPELSTEPTTVTQPIIQPDTTFSVVTQPIIQPQTSSVSTVTQPIPTLPVSVVTQSIPTLGAAGATSRGTTKIVTTVAPSPVALKDLIRTTSQPNLFIQLPQLRVLKQNGTEESSNLNHTRSNHKSNSTTTANRTAHISSPILQINKSAIDNSSQVIRIDRTNFTTELTPVDDADLSTNSNNNAIPDDLFHSLNTTSTQPSENNNVDSRKLHFTW